MVMSSGVGSLVLLVSRRQTAITISPPLHHTQVRGLKGIRCLQLARVLTNEELPFFDELDKDESEDFAEVSTRDAFLNFKISKWLRRRPMDEAHLESLFAGLVRRLVDNLIVFRPRDV